MAKKQIEQLEEIDAIEITNAVAEELAAELIAEDEYKEHAAEVSAKQEREQLIAEACRMAGRIEGLTITSKFADVSALLQLQKMKEEKIYKDMPGIGTWENFCISVGISSKKVDEDLRNLDTFGSEFLLTVSNYGIGYRELRQLKRAKSDGVFAIESDSVVIDGEVIQLSDKDELKDALEQLVAEQNRKIKAKDAELAEKSTRLEETQKLLTTKQTIVAAHAQTINRLSTELDRTKTARIYNDGTHLEDDPIYQELLKLEHETEVLLVKYDKAARLELSEFQQNMFGGVLMKFFKQLDDVREALFAADDTHYFDNMYLTEDQKLMVENMMTPSKYMHSEK